MLTIIGGKRRRRKRRSRGGTKTKSKNKTLTAGKRKRRRTKRKTKTKRRKRPLNAYFKKMLAAKKKGDKSFIYKGKKYVGRKHKNLGMIYKKA